MSLEIENCLEMEDINSKGYGVLPKLLMQDTRLTIEAKGIYAYIVTYAGAGKTAFPSLKKILLDLGIAKNRFYKHRKLLMELGYLTVTPVRNEKKEIIKNIYTLNQYPQEHMESKDSDPMLQNEPYPIHQNKPYPIHQNEEHKSNKFEINKIKDTAKRETKKQDTALDKKLQTELLATFHICNDQSFLSERSLEFIAMYSKTIQEAHDLVGIILRAKKKAEKDEGKVLIADDWQEEIDLQVIKLVRKLKTDHTIQEPENYWFKTFYYFFQQCCHQLNKADETTPSITVSLHNWLE